MIKDDELRIIFLDIDGVLCTLRSHLAFGDKGGLMEAWDVTCCQMIRRLCAKYNYEIVISSTWRNSKADVLSYYLCLYGLIEHCHKFPDFATAREKTQAGDHWRTPCIGQRIPGRTRGTEIKMWLDAHPEVTKYIIIDDDSDMLDEQKPFHIKTSTDEGFGARNMIDCVQLIQEMN